jgi:hypothetical protein
MMLGCVFSSEISIFDGHNFFNGFDRKALLLKRSVWIWQRVECENVL